MATGVFTQEFAHEFEAERGRWLRKRFLWYAAVVIGFSVLATIASLIGLFVVSKALVPRPLIWSTMGGLGVTLVGTVLYAIGFFKVYTRQYTREGLLRLVVRLILAAGLLGQAGNIINVELTRPLARRAYAYQDAVRELEQARRDAEAAAAETAESGEAADVDESASAEPAAPVAAPLEAPEVRVQHIRANFSKRYGVSAWLMGASGAWGIFVTHFFACLFLPWSPRESLKPIIPLFIANTVVTAIYGVGEWWAVAFMTLLSVLAAGPGLLIAMFRHSRFRDKFSHRMLRHRYSEVRKELVDARRIHESLFPEAISEGPIRFHYHYEPMRQIGGDFLYSRTASVPGRMLPVLDVTIIDVTGHGISAALTVNRLYGELERQYGEHASIAPGKLLTGLNTYIHNTLASHSVYATALCLRIDPNDDTLTWASAGHPPAFVRTVDGKLHQLNSTTLVLGACHGNDFAPHPEKMHFGQGDVLLAYTDGAIEARSATGAMLKIEGLMGMIHSCRATQAGSIGKALVEALSAFRYGNALDDTLFVEVFRPVDSRTEDRAAIMSSPASSR